MKSKVKSAFILVLSAFFSFSVIAPPFASGEEIPFQLRDHSLFNSPEGKRALFEKAAGFFRFYSPAGLFARRSVEIMRANFAMVHSARVKELLIWLLQNDTFALEDEFFREFIKDFLSEIRIVFSGEADLLKGVKGIFSQFERAGIVTLLSQLENMHRMVLPQILMSFLRVLLLCREEKLEGNLEQLREFIQGQFRAKLAEANVAHILKHGIEVKAQAENRLILDENKFILAPLIAPNRRKAVAYPNRKVLEKWAAMIEEGEDQMFLAQRFINLYVAREYKVLELLESGFDFDEAHAMVLKEPGQKDLWEFMMAVVREILDEKASMLSPKPNALGGLAQSPSVASQDLRVHKVEPDRLKRILKAMTIQENIKKLGEQIDLRMKKNRRGVIEIRFKKNSLMFTLADGNWIYFLADEKEGAIEIHVSNASMQFKEKLFEVGEELLRLLELWAREEENIVEEEPKKIEAGVPIAAEEEKEEDSVVNPEIDKFRELLMHQEESVSELEKLPIGKKLLDATRENGISDRLVAEYLTPGDILKVKLSSAKDPHPERAIAAYSMIKGGIALAAAILPEGVSVESSEIELKERAVQTALSAGLLRLPPGNSYRGILFRHPHLGTKSKENLLETFSKRIGAVRTEGEGAHLVAQASGVVTTAKVALVNMRIVGSHDFAPSADIQADAGSPEAKAASGVFAGVQGLSKKGLEIALKALEHGFRVVAVSTVGDDGKTFYKKGGFSKTDLTELFRNKKEVKCVTFKGEDYIFGLEGLHLIFLTEGDGMISAVGEDLVAGNGKKINLGVPLLVESQYGVIDQSAKALLMHRAREHFGGEPISKKPGKEVSRKKEIINIESQQKIFEERLKMAPPKITYYIPAFFSLASGATALKTGLTDQLKKLRPLSKLLKEATENVFVRALFGVKVGRELSYFCLDEASYLEAFRGLILFRAREDKLFIEGMSKLVLPDSDEIHYPIPKNFWALVQYLRGMKNIKALGTLVRLSGDAEFYAEYRILLEKMLDLLHNPIFKDENRVHYFAELVAGLNRYYDSPGISFKTVTEELKKIGEDMGHYITRNSPKKPFQDPSPFWQGPGKGLAAWIIGISLWGGSLFLNTAVHAAERISQSVMALTEPPNVQWIYPKKNPESAEILSLSKKMSAFFKEDCAILSKTEVWTIDLNSFKKGDGDAVRVPRALEQMVGKILDRALPNQIRFVLLLNENMLDEALAEKMGQNLGIPKHLLTYAKTPEEMFRKMSRFGDLSYHVVTTDKSDWIGRNVSEIIQLLKTSLPVGYDGLGELDFEEQIPLFFKTHA